MNKSPFRDFLTLFFPDSCVGCKHGLALGEDLLCSRCVNGLPFLDYCQYPENPLSRRLVAAIDFAHAVALLKFQPGGLVQHLLHALKYGNLPEVGLRMGRLLGEQIGEKGIVGRTEHLSDGFDLIIPVPLYRSRERKRGYNQSAMIAEGLSSVLNVPVGSNVIKRFRHTATQTRYDRAERWRNMVEAFRVVNPGDIEGRRILMVDDVITTGATIEACSRAIMSFRPRSISAACLADVP